MKKKTKRRSDIKRIKRDGDGYEDTETFDGVNIDGLVPVDPPPWLPSPAELARSIQNNRITILIDNEVVGFFKKHARLNNVSYQRLIREALRAYVREKKKGHRAA